jgi:hypothetical protein
MSVIALPASPNVSVNGERFRLRRSEAALPLASGVAQITSFPSRLWTMQINVIPMRTANLRLWTLFALQMSSLANVFAYGPPHYAGPSTGYAGAAPLVAGGSQLGTTLAVDGLTHSVPILSKGDFFSFDVTSPQGNTNRQLNAVTTDVSSDGFGAASLPLLLPIRQAPADDATVNISTPTALFRLVDPENGLDFDDEGFSQFSFDVIEAIFP